MVGFFLDPFTEKKGLKVGSESLKKRNAFVQTKILMETNKRITLNNLRFNGPKETHSNESKIKPGARDRERGGEERKHCNDVDKVPRTLY